jgi:predicted RNA-binding protein with TRAM domain
MQSKTNEQALESTIEKRLTGSCLEDLKSQGVSINSAEERASLYRSGNGYYIGIPEDFNAKYAIDEVRFWDFLQSTQKEELAKLQKQSDWKLKILERLDRMIKKYGILRLFRKGLDVDDAHFTLLYPLPLASSSKTVIANFESNQFSSTRQLRYSLSNTKEEIDMVLFVNGLPFATMELKEKKQQVIENLLVIDISAEGKGVAKWENRVVFITKAVPGDVVDAKVIKKKKNLLEAEILEIKVPSKNRIEAVCEHFGSCGGCKWQFLAYGEQLKIKEQQVKDSVHRLGRAFYEIRGQPGAGAIRGAGIERFSDGPGCERRGRCEYSESGVERGDVFLSKNSGARAGIH